MDIVTYSQVRDEVVLENLGDLVSPAFQTLKAPPKTCFFSPWVKRPTDSHQCQQTQVSWAKDFGELLILEYNHTVLGSLSTRSRSIPT